MIARGLPWRRLAALALVLPLAALAACDEEEREAAVEAPAQQPVYPAADGGPATGRFEIASADGGAMTVQEVLPGGRYRNLRDGRLVETGTWATPRPGVFCTTSDGGKTSCDEESLAPDGTWISVNVEDPAVRWIIRRLEETSEPPAA